MITDFDDKVDRSSIPLLLNFLIKQKQIRNISPIKIFDIFGFSSFDLSRHTCYSIGYSRENVGKKAIFAFKICGCSSIPFKGKHTLQYVGTNDVIAVHSLTSLRVKKWFLDKLSFERSTFIIIDDKAIRLSQIRHLVQLPLLNGEGLSTIRYSLPLPPFKIEPNLSNYMKFIEYVDKAIELYANVNQCPKSMVLDSIVDFNRIKMCDENTDPLELFFHTRRDINDEL